MYKWSALEAWIALRVLNDCFSDSSCYSDKILKSENNLKKKRFWLTSQGDIPSWWGSHGSRNNRSWSHCIHPQEAERNECLSSVYTVCNSQLREWWYPLWEILPTLVSSIKIIPNSQAQRWPQCLTGVPQSSSPRWFQISSNWQLRLTIIMTLIIWRIWESF